MPIEPSEEVEEESIAEETAVLSPTLIGGQEVSPGDVVRLQVVSIGDDGITVKYAAEEVAEEEPDMMAMTNKFNEKE
jgi:hypothetical protein